MYLHSVRFRNCNLNLCQYHTGYFYTFLHYPIESHFRADTRSGKSRVTVKRWLL